MDVPLTFGVLLNLASVCNTEDKAVLWGFVGAYANATPEDHPMLDDLVGYAAAYYRDFVKPKKSYRIADANERTALEDLERTLAALPAGASAEDIQSEIYEVGKRHDFASLRDWFAALYEVLFGQPEGPRMGSFVALYGIANFRALIAAALAGEIGVGS